MTFGERLRSIRIKNNMSQQDLSNILHVTPQTVSKWENDLSEPSFQIITDMTNIFHISFDELFYGESKVLFKGPIYTANKDLRMKKYYHSLQVFLIFLSLSLIMTTVYISTIEILTWHFTLGFVIFTAFWLFTLFMMTKWRYDFLDSPNELIDVYYEKLVFKKTNLSIDFNNIKHIQIKKYSLFNGIYIFENNGYLKIYIEDKQVIIVRDIDQIEDFKRVINKIKKIEVKRK